MEGSPMSSLAFDLKVHHLESSPGGAIGADPSEVRRREDMDNGVAESEAVWRGRKQRRLGQTVSVGEKWIASWVPARENRVGSSNEVNWGGWSGVEAMSMEEEEEPEPRRKHHPDCRQAHGTSRGQLVW